MNNGKWQLAFWVITFICGTWLIGITTGVVANDRIRSSEDIRIVKEAEYKVENLRKELSNDIKEIKTEQTAMRISQGQIITILERVERKVN